MTYYPEIPENPNLRQVILILPKATREAIAYEKKYKKFNSLINNEQVCVLDYPFLEENHNLIKNNVDSFTPNNLVIQNPLNHDNYAKVIDTVTDFPLAKWNAFTKICQELGATKVRVRYKHLTRLKERKYFFFGFISPIGFFSDEEKRKLKKTFLLEIRIDKEYNGSEPNIDKAINIVSQNNLDKDPHIEGLINDREGNNLVKISYVKLEFFREISSSFKTVSSLVVPDICTGLREQVEFAKALRKFTIEYEVQYPGYEPSMFKKITEQVL